MSATAKRSNRWPIGRIAGAAALAAALGVGGWAWVSRDGSSPRAAIADSLHEKPVLDPGFWSTSPAGDSTGIARARTLIAYQPARDKRDYRLEAAARIEQQALGIVFRVHDARNYYCWKVELASAGRAGAARLVQFAVIDGREQPHRVTSLPGPLSPEVRVRVEARGPVFTLYLNDAAADTFTDSRIASGSAGFSNENGERAVIKMARWTD